MTAEKDKVRYVLLDGMRGDAAIGLMSYHLWLGDFRISQGLNTFVDFFFVLSGFVLAPKVLDNSNGSKKRFIYSRILRLYPMLIPIFITLLLTQKFPLISEHFNNKPQMDLTQYLSAFLLLHIFWATLIQLNPPLWSLSAEWFINLFAIFFHSKKIFLPMVFIGVIGQGLGIYLDHKYQLNWGVIKYTIGIGRVMVGFYLGIMLRQSISSKQRVSSTKRLLISLLVCSLVFYLYGYSVYLVILVAPICWFIIGEVARIDERKIPNFIRKASTYLGMISYGVYCWHAVLGWMSIPAFLLTRFGLELDGFERTIFDIGITFILIFALTEMSIRIFELPIRNFAKRKIKGLVKE